MSAVRPRVLAAGAVALALVGATLAQGTYAAGIPANKVAASGSSVERLDATADTLLLSETVKINNPTDLILGVSLECAINTKVTNSADGDLSEAFGEIKIYVTIDGVPVRVSDSSPNDGKVVFCNRAQGQRWTNSANSTDGDEDDTLTQYQNTRNANAFNWMALNVGTAGDNIHKIQVWADWTIAETGEAVASAAVGNRTLILEPVKSANREAVTEFN